MLSDLRSADAARLLLAARAGTTPRMTDLPPELRPADMAAAYAIQAATIAALGPIGGWKVGASGLHDTPARAPLPASGIKLAPATWPEHGGWVECEIAFRIGKPLPPRAEPYSNEEVLGVIETAHPALELLTSRYADIDRVSPLSGTADLANHGGLVVGPAIEGWQALSFPELEVELLIDGQVELRRVGSNAAVDLLRLVGWLMGPGAAEFGGVAAGAYVTTGSWTGKSAVRAGGEAVARFGGRYSAEVRYGV